MTERPNFYRAIHKALRRATALFLADLGSVNPEDRGAVTAICRRWEGLQAVLEGHAHHEDAHVGPALAESDPDLFGVIEADHAAHHAGLVEVEKAFAVLEVAEADHRAARLQEAYLAVTRFMATDLQHMFREETEIMPALQAKYDDGHLLGIHGRIIASLSPEEKARTFRLMFPALHEPERLELMQALRSKMPSEAFEGLKGLVASVLQPAEWQSLCNRLELTAVMA